MMEIEYLSETDQYKELLNNVEIAKIKDQELREIRQRYWELRYKAFLDEQGIKDSDLESVWNKLKMEEQMEIKEYRKKRGEI